MSATPAAAGAGEMAGGDISLLDVNRDLRMVVLDAGSLKGLRPGLVLSVLKGDRPVARVRTTVVRERITGAVIDEVYADAYPERGDRVMPMKQSDR
jgi:hypothetical protein